MCVSMPFCYFGAAVGKYLKEGNYMDYYSHYREKDDSYQLNCQHQQNVAELCERNCCIPLLKKTAYITGLSHDCGKETEEWNEYFLKNCRKDVWMPGEKLDHSTLGGLIIESYERGSIFADMVRIAIFMHHGIRDCAVMDEKISLAEKRKKKYSEEKILEMRESCEKEAVKSGQLSGRDNNMQELCRAARKDIEKLTENLKQLLNAKENKNKYGSIHFYLGMCERMLFSLLGDADVIDTVAFQQDEVQQDEERKTGLPDEEIHQIWKEALDHLELKLCNMKTDQKAASPLNDIREEISVRCKEAAYEKASRYRLAVPTGAGKTLSSLRFALTRAAECGMRHIFYVAPFRSILEQNTADIIDAVGNEKWVLEHHGEVVLEEKEESMRYERLIENWDEVPIIATTAVQFFNTLIKVKKRNLRRFHALCKSVIILDEVQAFPPKVMALFNLSVNFLTEVCGSVVVLCTATQPLTEDIAKNKMMKTARMKQPLSVYEPDFRRVVYKDCTDGGRQKWDIEEAAQFIRDKADAEEQILTIFNTKSAAKKVYDKLKGQVTGELFHLSTSMCAAHRNDVLKKIKEILESGRPVTCVSTQIVEAGWDVSFHSVIRSMAGLDNLIQAAGRCNRNGVEKAGYVYLIQMNETAENVASLPEIRKAQEAMREVLNRYCKKPADYGERLDSEEMIQQYYTAYLRDQSDLCYPVKKTQTDLVDLLSDNKLFDRPRKFGPYLRQAFQTAGEAFSLIEEQKGIDVVVPYEEAELLLSKLDKPVESGEQKILMRKLQRYIVNVSEYMLKKIGKDAVFRREDGILVLDGRYYDAATGVKEEPEEMQFLTF